MGLATGIICSGMLLMLWFSLPFAERKFPVDDIEMFFPCHRFTAKAAGFASRHMGGGKTFRGEAYLRDLRYGVPHIPSLGDGYYISSVPTGLRVFIAAGRIDNPEGFLEKVMELLGKPEDELRPSEKNRPLGYRGRTPIFIKQAQKSALFAVVMDDIPAEVGSALSDPTEVFVPDGEMGVAKPAVSLGYNLFIKMYRVDKKGNIGTLIALFQPKGKAYQHKVEEYLPSRECFRFNDQQMITKLMAAGATHQEATRLARQLHLGGKAVFVGRDEKPFAAEITGQNRYRIFEPPEPEDLDKALEDSPRGRSPWR